MYPPLYGDISFHCPPSILLPTSPVMDLEEKQKYKKKLNKTSWFSKWNIYNAHIRNSFSRRCSLSNTLSDIYCGVKTEDCSDRVCPTSSLIIPSIRQRRRTSSRIGNNQVEGGKLKERCKAACGGGGRIRKENTQEGKFKSGLSMYICFKSFYLFPYLRFGS